MEEITLHFQTFHAKSINLKECAFIYLIHQDIKDII